MYLIVFKLLLVREKVVIFSDTRNTTQSSEPYCAVSHFILIIYPIILCVCVCVCVCVCIGAGKLDCIT